MNLSARSKRKNRSYPVRLLNDITVHKSIYTMMLLVAVYYFIFSYLPMYGIQIAFKQYRPMSGIWGSSWVGLKYFRQFFSSVFVFRLIRNTFLLSFYGLIFGFPMPILLALLLNELRSNKFKRVVQNITYLPHFVSTVVICGLIVNYSTSEGLFNQVAALFGAQPRSLLNIPGFFRPMYVASGIWAGAGWGSILYLAALTGINPELYEAARVDGASRWKQTLHITLPGITPTIMITLILRIGSLFSEGAGKVILLYNPGIYETADIIASFVYRKGLLEMDYSYSTAINLFNSLINVVLLVSANTISRKMTENSLW